MAKYDICYEDIMLLDECGMIYLNESIIEIQVLNTECEQLSYGNKKIEIRGTNENITRLNISAYFLTKSGQDLMDLISVELEDEYLNDIQRILETKNKNIACSIL